MKFLTDAAYRTSAISQTVNQLLGGQSPAALFGLPDIAKAVFLSCLCEKTEQKIIVLTAAEADGAALAKDLTVLGQKCVVVPARDYVFGQDNGYSKEYEHRRINALYRILTSDYDVALIDIESLTALTVPPEKLQNAAVKIEVGGTLSIEQLRSKLTQIGYRATEQVDGPGQFSVRGGIVDVFSTAEPAPVRIELFGDEVDLLSYFEIESQRRTDNIQSFTVLPATEFFYEPTALAECLSAAATAEKKQTEYTAAMRRDAERLLAGELLCADRYLSYLPYRPVTPVEYFGTAFFAVCDMKAVTQRQKALTARRLSDLAAAFEQGLVSKHTEFFAPKGFLKKVIEQRRTVYLENFNHASFPVPPMAVSSAVLKRLSPFSGGSEALYDDLRSYGIGRGTVVLGVGSEKIADILAEELATNGFSATVCDLQNISGSGIFITVCPPLSAGLEFCDIGAAFITYKTITVRKNKQKRRTKQEIFNSLDELKMGDYVVHSAHGIGCFDGIHRMRVGSVIKDYIKIKYHGTDVLYVPVTQLDMVSRYIGTNTENGPKLNRLGGTEWQKTRARVRAAVTDMAKELTALYAKRMQQSGYAFSPDTDLQNDFERRFVYEETEDQLRAINEIKNDMQRNVPMDRLLCGDVGFGKTEVALRAAFKCIADSKQCALLVPTTILAFQHYLTVKERIGSLPVNIELLSRFKTPTEIKKILKRLKSGDIDMVIGTHRLISKDVAFKDLGLVIIDEEQRFGVAQKERLKSLYPTVDVLTLTATPIPRTLNMAMSGIRDMSMIEEAPQDRQPVQTFVTEYNKGMLLEAIGRELRRDGQVYYLHNRVETIHACAARLQEALPNATIGVAHGKMSEEQLSTIWSQLLKHEIDVLVCTTIIETGVDVPNVNTLIIENADRMGLAQLHQLRGRVGRSARRAYAYFCFKSGKQLTEVAEKRLEAIREYTAFGSGFKIAMRDLEIRGAGSILGGEQHGHMESVGYDMYVQMLSDAVDAERGIEKTAAPDCAVDLSINANIPERYIPALSHRLEMYRRIADIKSPADRLDVIDELCDRFGEPPQEVMGLMDISLLRNAAAKNGIDEITGDTKAVDLHIKNFQSNNVAEVLQKLGDLATLVTSVRPCYRVKIPAGKTPIQILNVVAERLAPDVSAEK